MSEEATDSTVARPEDAKDVFLSYAREDAEAADAVAEALVTEGLSVWRDVASLRAGDLTDRVIRDALATVRTVVVLWSAASVDSRWVNAEAEVAAEATKLIPARLDDSEPPLQFRPLHTVSLVRWTDDDSRSGIVDLAAAVRKKLGTGVPTERAEGATRGPAASTAAGLESRPVPRSPLSTSSEPTRASSRRWVAVIAAAIAAGVLVFVALLLFSNGATTRIVPDLIGGEREMAVQILRDRDLAGAPSEACAPGPIGIVIAQDPDADLQVEAGTAVGYTVTARPALDPEAPTFMPPFDRSLGEYLGSTYGPSALLPTGHEPFAVDFNRGVGTQDRGDPVLAAADGIVVDVNRSPENPSIRIEHDGRYDTDVYSTLYGNIAEPFVQVGEVVTAGQQIAEIGWSPGGQSFLHFETSKNGEAMAIELCIDGVRTSVPVSQATPESGEPWVVVPLADE